MVRLPIGGITRGFDHGFGFGFGVDHRNDYAPGAGVEDAFDVFGAVDRHARQRNAATAGDDGITVRGGFETGGRVFEFDREPIETDMGHEVRGDRAGEGEPRADGSFAAFEFGANRIRFHQVSLARRFGEEKTFSSTTQRGRRPWDTSTMAWAAAWLTVAPVSCAQLDWCGLSSTLGVLRRM
jgi:hypothetical protein